MYIAPDSSYLFILLRHFSISFVLCDSTTSCELRLIKLIVNFFIVFAFLVFRSFVLLYIIILSYLVLIVNTFFSNLENFFTYFLSQQIPNVRQFRLLFFVHFQYIQNIQLTRFLYRYIQNSQTYLDLMYLQEFVLI